MLAVAGCQDGAPDGSVDPSAPTTIATSSQETVDLAYAFAPGDALSYRLDLTQHLVLDTEGTASAVTGQDVPGSADVEISGTGDFTYTVDTGPRTGTFSILVEGVFEDVTVSGTADGEPVDAPEDLGGIGSLGSVSRTLVVDETGAIVDEGGEESDVMEVAGSALAGLSGDIGGLMGPVLPADPVSTGSTWTEIRSEPTLGEEAVETTVAATLTGTGTEQGVEALVIETESSSTEGAVDLSSFFAEFFGAFSTQGTGPTTTIGADMQAMMDQLVFRILFEPGSGAGTAWFDAETGRVLRWEQTASDRTAMEVALPDEETGQLQSFDMTLVTDQELVYTLAG